MSDFTETDRERMEKWCERPDGIVPYNAICRLFDSHEKQRRLLDDARAQKPVGDYGVDGKRVPLYAAPVPAQPAAVPEAVAKDAARYRWLRDENTNPGNVIDKRDGIHTGVHGEFMGYRYSYRCGADLDAKIDAAILSAADSEVKK